MDKKTRGKWLSNLRAAANLPREIRGRDSARYAELRSHYCAAVKNPNDAEVWWLLRRQLLQMLADSACPSRSIAGATVRTFGGCCLRVHYR